MADSFNQLDDIHVDVLREVGNIGASHAATALAKMLGKKIAVSVPMVRLVDFKDIADFVGGGETILIGILVAISGDLDGMMMFIVKTDTAHGLVKMLMGDMATGEDTEFTEMEQSAIQEIGNILCSSYLGSLAGLIDKKVVPSIPFLAIDMANAILSVPAIEFGKVADQALFIESVFTADDGADVSGYFLLVPDMPSFNRILTSLGVV